MNPTKEKIKHTPGPWGIEAELLEACQMLLDNCVDRWRAFPDTTMEKIAIEKAQTAIAKAEGRKENGQP